jgi:hypothetical protein
MSLAIFVSAYSGALRDQIRNFLVDNTAGAVASQTIPDLWLMFLAERGYTSGTLDDRLRQYLLAYTGASAGTTDDLWALITEPFSEGSDLLDLYPDAVVAYSSARRLRSAYSGPLIRVRRSSDSTEQDIGFDSETGLIDFRGSELWFCGHYV